MKLSAAVFLAAALAAPVPMQAQDPARPEAGAAGLKNLSIEELMQLDVTSVSRRSEPFSQVAAALSVITGEEIRRSGVTSLPDALRLVNTLQVARATQRDWAITARGFNSTTANKLLVLIDGRSVYTPLFSGVFWDVQDVLLEDIERIEVIRGPGATLWGANAVNGIINIITKRAEDTQGGLALAGAGTEEKAFGAVRYGGRLGDRGHYRAYGKAFDRDPLVFVTGEDARDPMRFGQGGFRADWRSSEVDAFTMQGDVYTGRSGDALHDDTDVDGGNLIGRWSRRPSERSDMELQVYWDRTHREIPDLFEEHRDTWDIDFQHSLHLREKHDVVWGLGYRHTRDRVGNSRVIGFFPDHRAQNLFSLFAQDEVLFLADRLHVTVGTKLEHNESTGLEVQPNVRFAWVPNERRTFWGAVSRAVRTPTRFDEDLVFFVAGRPFFLGSRDFESEKLLAYELGFRTQLQQELSLDIATFYNVYDDLRSQEPRPGGVIVFDNNLNAETWGVEVRSNFQPRPWWRWSAGYVWFDKHLHLDPGSQDPTGGRGEGNDPEHRAMLRTSIDLRGGVQLDGWLRWMGRLPSPEVPDYLTMDLRLGWRPTKSLELSLAGQNLLQDAHEEFGPATLTREEVERGVYGKVTWWF